MKYLKLEHIKGSWMSYYSYRQEGREKEGVQIVVHLKDKLMEDLRLLPLFKLFLPLLGYYTA